jgi:hypothetical protein
VGVYTKKEERPPWRFKWSEAGVACTSMAGSISASSFTRIDGLSSILRNIFKKAVGESCLCRIVLFWESRFQNLGLFRAIIATKTL